MKKALVLSPHPDDMEVNMGGTVIKMIGDSWIIRQIIFSDCVELVGKKFIEGAEKSAEELGIRTVFCEFPNQDFMDHRKGIRGHLHALKDINYDIVFVPCRQDWHQDHQVVTQEAIRIFRDSTILGYIKREIFDRHHDLKVELDLPEVNKRVWLLTHHFGLLNPSPNFTEWFEVIQMRNYL